MGFTALEDSVILAKSTNETPLVFRRIFYSLKNEALIMPFYSVGRDH
jgi:hypothetical protein